MLWTVLEKVPRNKGDKYSFLLCECACGLIKKVRSSSYGVDSFRCRKCHSHNKKHGNSDSNLYVRWSAMKQRCLYKKSNSAKNYSERGISICDEWIDNFDSFYQWSIKNGYHPDLSLDRIDNNKGYYPENCRWTTRSIQNKNQRKNIVVEIEGRSMILKDWCRFFDINYDSVRNKIYTGMTPKEAILLKASEKEKNP